MDAILWLAIALAIYLVKKSVFVEGLSILQKFVVKTNICPSCKCQLYQTVLKFEALTF